MSVARAFEICHELLAGWPSNPQEVAGLRQRFHELRVMTATSPLKGLVGWIEAAITVTSKPSCMDSDTADSLRVSLERMVRIVEDSHSDVARQYYAGKAAAQANLRSMNSMLLGEILCQLGLIQPEQVAEALVLQRELGIRFGEALLKLRIITPGNLEVGLRLQGQLSGPSNETDEPAAALPQATAHSSDDLDAPGQFTLRMFHDMFLGEILMRMQKIGRAQLDQALELQRKCPLRIGEALISIDAIDQTDLSEALRIQGDLRESSRPSGPVSSSFSL